MTTKLTVRTSTGSIRTLVAYKGADKRVRAFEKGQTTAAYVGASLMGIREQIDLDGDKIISADCLQN